MVRKLAVSVSVAFAGGLLSGLVIASGWNKAAAPAAEAARKRWRRFVADVEHRYLPDLGESVALGLTEADVYMPLR